MAPSALASPRVRTLRSRAAVARLRPLASSLAVARLPLPLAAGLAALALSGCTPHIGDRCTLNTDCSIQGTLQCDNSQPGGYCTFFLCQPDSCQDRAACVLLQANVPGCPYSDYHSPSRTGRSMCLAQCQQDSDCRTGDGYVCRDPRQPPWNAVILDDDQSQKVCIQAPDYDAGIPASYVQEDGGVCAPSGPPVPGIDAGAGAGADAGTGAGAGADAMTDGAAQSGAADAFSGG
jgi:hypothetical protein